jgi:adenylate cyclase
MEADDTATVATLDASRGVFRDKVSTNGGRVVDTTGDSVLAIFPSAISAVKAAISLQEQLHERNEQLPEDQRMHFRLGVNLGDVIEKSDGSVYGSGVNVAARLEGLAEPGGILISEDVHRQVAGKLDRTFEDAGTHAVKNIADPVHVYQMVDSVSRPAAAPDNDADGPSIAVLPFENMSGDAEQDYFADGITEEIITALSRFRDLVVIARNSTFQYKGQAVDVRAVGRELGASYVLEGSVRRAGMRIRATAQLLDAITGSHLWAETYQRDLTAVDIFDVQDDIAERVVGAIADTYGVLSRTQIEQKKRRGTDSIDAFEAVLRARAYYRDTVSAADHLRVRDALEHAVDLAPRYADAWAWLAATYRDERYFRYNPRPNSVTRAETAARKAINLDPENHEANLVLAQVHFLNGNAEAFRAQADKTISLNPNSADKLASLASSTCFIGDWDRGVAMALKAIRLSARSPGLFFYVPALDHYRKGEYTEALALAQKIDLPQFYRTHLLLAAIYGQLGRRGPAQAALSKLIELYPEFATKGWFELRRVNYPENLIAQLIEGLRKAGLDVPEEPME